jgi:pheromone shutdown protein TraB
MSVKSQLDKLTKNGGNDGEKAETIIELDAPLNGKVYLVGTAHFSVESNKEVAELIRRVKPDRVVLELCPSRSNILKLDEETVLKEAKEMDMNKVIQMIKQVSQINFYI